jgi:hypothetical protein
MNRKETYSIYRNTGPTLRPSQAYVNYLSMNYKCNVQSHCWPHTTNTIFSQTSCPITNKANDGRHCFENFYLKLREPINNCAKRRKVPRICVDARKVNRYTLPESARFLAIPELLKQFHGSKLITSTELSLALLQIGLKRGYSKYTVSYIYLQSVLMVSETLPQL